MHVGNPNFPFYADGRVLQPGFMGRSGLYDHQCVYNAELHVPVRILFKECGKEPQNII